jgi:hypothetical protein
MLVVLRWYQQKHGVELRSAFLVAVKKTGYRAAQELGAINLAMTIK